MSKFRERNPERTYIKKHNKYSEYRQALIRDFNNRCGYTDCPDKWFGGSRTFTIDHFKPRALYPELVSEYSNLVYSCSYVNFAKGADYSEKYLDPCDVDFNEHFERGIDGMILPKPHSEHAQYMYRRLKLGLRRYQLIWLIEKIDSIISRIEKVMSKNEPDIPSEIKDLHYEFLKEYKKYIEYLHKAS